MLLIVFFGGIGGREGQQTKLIFRKTTFSYLIPSSSSLLADNVMIYFMENAEIIKEMSMNHQLPL
jgi:hypothetical protein